MLSPQVCPLGPASRETPHPLLSPTGTEYHVDMSRTCPRCLDAKNSSDHSPQADLLLREEPDDEDEDEGDRKEDDEHQDTDDGYSE